MDSINKTILRLLKTSIYLSIVAFAVMYICSYMWLKMGMSYTPTLFNHAVMEANANINMPNVKKGDLVVAKEYLYSNTPQIHDIVVYPLEEEIKIGIVEKINNDDDGLSLYKVTLSDKDTSINLYKEDIIGELSFVAPGLGKLGTFLVSPLFIIVLYGLVGLSIILYKINSKNNRLEKVVLDKTDNIESSNISRNDSYDDKIDQNNLNIESKDIQDNSVEIKEIASNINTKDLSNSSLDNTSNNIGYVYTKKAKRKINRKQNNKNKTNKIKKHNNKYNHKAKSKQKYKHVNKYNHKKKYSKAKKIKR